MSSLDDLIQQSAAEELPDFSDVSGGASPGLAASPAPSGLDALIHASVQDLSAPDFGDVSGGAASSARSLPEQSAPPAPAGLDPAFMHWYANYVKNTRAELSYDQARQLYKSLTPEQRASAVPKDESWAQRYERESNIPSAQQNREELADEFRNIASGAKATADFAVHAPQLLGNLMISDAFMPPGMSVAPGSVEKAIPLPDLVEETFQSSREERQRLQDRAAARGAETGQTPEAAALAYAVPQALGNLIDPAMAIGAGKGAKAAEAGASWLDRLIARGAEEELGPRAADAAEPVLTHAVEPSAELRQHFPEATIDSREYVEPPGQRRVPQEGQPLPAPPEGIKPGEPWLQQPIGAPAAPGTPKTVDLGGAGQAIADNLYDGMWSRLEAGKLPEPFPAEGQSPAARLAAEAYARGELKGPEDIRTIMNDYARRTYGKDEADAALRSEERAHASQQAPVSSAVEERHPAAESGGLEGQGEVVASGEGPRFAGYRGQEGDLALGAEGADGPQPGQPLAPGGGPEALSPGDGSMAEGGGGESLKPFAPGELPPELPQLTALKKAYSEPERAERGLSPVEREFFGTTDETMAKARAAVDADPSYPRQLAQKLIEEDRPPRPHEVAELLYDKAKILNEEKAAMNALETARAAGDDVAEADARGTLARAQQALDVNTEASRRSLAQWGEAGRLSQLVIREDYSTSRVLQRARAAAADGAVPPELEKKLTDLSTRVETTSKALDEAKDQIAAMRLKKALGAMQRETELEGRKAARRQVRQSLDEELADLSGQLEKRAAAKQGKLFSTANPFQGLDPESIAIIGKIAKNRVKAGVNTAEGLVDSVFQIVRNHFEGITPRDVQDAISGYGNAPKGSRAVAESQLSRVKRELRMLSKIEDAQAGKMPAKGATPRKPSPQIKALEKRLRQEMRAQGLDRNMRLDARRALLESRKADLERQLVTGDFTPVGRPLAVEDATTRKLKVEIEEAKRKIDYEVRKIQAKNRTFPQKVIHNLVKARRAVLLSSSSALGKLFSAATYRTLLTTPAKQAIGALYAQAPLIRRIAAMAPREGTVSLRAETEAIKEFFSPETWKDAYKTAMPAKLGGRGTGMSELDTLYGKKDMPPELLDFFGHIHNGEKTLAKRPEFVRSMELRMKHAEANGINVDDPEVLSDMHAKAYDDALRAVLLEDNILTEFHKAGKARLHNLRVAEAKQRGEELGQVIKPPEGNPVIDFMLPITKVASNYAGQEIEGALGIPRAALRMLRRDVIRKGVDNLSERDAEYIMRNLKAGTLGPAVFALGYYNYKSIGGYRQRNEHPGEGEPRPMTVQANIDGNDVTVPHNVLHDPTLELMQAGATFHKVKEAYEDRDKKYAAGAGALAAVRGSAEQVPFYGELLRTQNALETPKGMMEFGGNLTRSFVIPPDIQRLARVLDQEQSPGPFAGAAEQLGLKHFEPVRRYPQNFLWDQFKVGIPWAREQVSDEKNP